jgi:hypothetical protein
MVRYFALATIIVVGALVVLANLAPARKPLGVANVRATGTPSAPRIEPTSTARGGAAVVGTAPWALSALPECFVQDFEAHGTYAFARSQLPSGMQPIRPGSRLESVDCVLHVAAHSGLVERGAERLSIPPDAQFLWNPKQLALLRKTGPLAELRLYHMTGRASVSIAPDYLNPPR